jgi:hypothetical protein
LVPAEGRAGKICAIGGFSNSFGFADLQPVSWEKSCGWAGPGVAEAMPPQTPALRQAPGRLRAEPKKER